MTEKDECCLEYAGQRPGTQALLRRTLWLWSLREREVDRRRKLNRRVVHSSVKGRRTSTLDVATDTIDDLLRGKLLAENFDGELAAAFADDVTGRAKTPAKLIELRLKIGRRRIETSDGDVGHSAIQPLQVARR